MINVDNFVFIKVSRCCGFCPRTAWDTWVVDIKTEAIKVPFYRPENMLCYISQMAFDTVMQEVVFGVDIFFLFYITCNVAMQLKQILHQLKIFFQS